MQVFVDWVADRNRPAWLDWLIEDGLGVGLLAVFVAVAIGSLVAVPALWLLGY